MTEASAPVPGSRPRLTPARVGLGRSGTAQTTAAHLSFQADHALAREAVHAPFSADVVAAELAGAGIPTVEVATLSTDRTQYLHHPEAGRRLTGPSRARLAAAGDPGPDVVLILSDGLSATAVHRHGAALVTAVVTRLRRQSIVVAPIVVAPFARVGLLNDVGAAVGARVAAIVLGERPGLSAPDSLGLYCEYAPAPALTDADRNCLSNIRPGGLPLEVAADRAALLLTTTLARRISGVQLTVEYDEGLPARASLDAQDEVRDHPDEQK